MRADGLVGACRGRRPRTTVPATVPDARPDVVQRQSLAERRNQRWVADFTYVLIWRGFPYVAFVIEVFSRRRVGWRTRRTCAAISRWTRSSRRYIIGKRRTG